MEFSFSWTWGAGYEAMLLTGGSSQNPSSASHAHWNKTETATEFWKLHIAEQEDTLWYDSTASPQFLEQKFILFDGKSCGDDSRIIWQASQVW